MSDPAATLSAESVQDPRSARGLLVDWANQQDGWVRQLVAEVFASQQAISGGARGLIYQQFLTEKDLADGQPGSVADLTLEEEAGSASADFLITTLSNVRGVNALAPEQTIEFNPRLTILFGENASGKTGYTRVLKRLAAVRTAEVILPDVHDPSAPTVPEATIEYAVAGDHRSLEWKGEEGVSPFTYLGIFDAPAVRVHLDDDLSYVYTPSDLSLFPHINDGIVEIRAVLQGAVEERRPSGNAYLRCFTTGTSVYTLVETLGAATDVGQLRKLADVSETEAKQVKVLQERVDALRTDTIPAQLSVARTLRSLHDELVAAATAMSAFNHEAYNQAVAAGVKAEADNANLRKELFARAGLEGEGDEVWESFILSAKDYGEHLVDHDYPDQGDSCLYCQQPLGTEALALLSLYRDFANDATRQRASDARDLAVRLAADVAAIDRSGLAEAVAREQEGGPEGSPFDTAAQVLETLDEQQQATSTQEPVVWTEIAPLAEEVAKESEAQRDEAAKLITGLTAKAEERLRALQEARTEHNQLKDRIELQSRLDDISDYVENAKWIQRSEQLLTRFPVLLRSFTETAKMASERLLNTDFAQRFEEECQALRAPAVVLEFPGRHGQAARRKTILDSHKPSAVLSEGEQKVIALADFLAEASLRLTPAPLVLDDPVTSLDYRRIDEVADRVTELASGRQVIVFTHNIWFTTKLLAMFEGDTEHCAYYSVSDDPDKGTITHGTHPRWDTIRITGGKINHCISSASTSEGETRAALIERAYSLIRAWSEVVVEEELLAGVTHRYQPHVMMTALSRIKGQHLETATSVILPIFERACRFTEAHSQPLETLGTRPTLEQLETDWAQLQEARKAYADAE